MSITETHAQQAIDKIMAILSGEVAFDALSILGNAMVWVIMDGSDDPDVRRGVAQTIYHQMLKHIEETEDDAEANA